MKIRYRSVFQNFFWFLISSALYRLICWAIGFHPFPLRDLCAIAWGFFAGGIALRYFVNTQAERAFRHTLADWGKDGN